MSGRIISVIWLTIASVLSLDDTGSLPSSCQSLITQHLDTLTSWTVDTALKYLPFQSTLSGDPAISPFGLALTLSELQSGAGGQTEKQLSAALMINGATEGTSKEAFQALLKCLRDTPHVHVLTRRDVTENAHPLALITKLIISSKYQVEPEFARAMRTYYDAELKQVDFTDTKAASIASGFVSYHRPAEPYIKPGDLSPDTTLIGLAVQSAICQLNWNKKSDKFSNSKGSFDVDYLAQDLLVGQYKEMKDIKAMAFFIECGGGNNSALFISPHKSDGIQDLVTGLKSLTTEDIFRELFFAKVNISIPKFKARTGINLRESLPYLDVFSPTKANLTLISKTQPNIKLDGIFQTVSVIVDKGPLNAPLPKSGYEAYLTPDTKVLKLDHPFVYMIFQNVYTNLSKKAERVVTASGIVTDPRAGAGSYHGPQ